jgi:hypothetical protein
VFFGEASPIDESDWLSDLKAMPPKAKTAPSTLAGNGSENSPKVKSPLGRAGASVLGSSPKTAASTNSTSPGVKAKSPSVGRDSIGKGTGAMEGTLSVQSASTIPPKAPSGSSIPVRSVAPTDSADVSPEAVLKFHSAVRWAKPWPDIEATVEGLNLKQVLSAQDPKNGNTALHIASQNGHLELVRKMVAEGAPVNKQNGKGQTPLHMSVEYDFYFVSKFLVDEGADKELKNEDGHKAIEGIDGGKTDSNAWDNQVMILRAATTSEQFDIAFEELEKALANPEVVSKEMLVQTGMLKKKSPDTKDIWDHKRFMALAAKF